MYTFQNVYGLEGPIARIFTLGNYKRLALKVFLRNKNFRKRVKTLVAAQGACLIVNPPIDVNTGIVRRRR